MNSMRCKTNQSIFFLLFQHLADINKWGMDVIKVAEFSNNRALTCVTYTILQVTHTTWIILKKEFTRPLDASFI